MNVNQTTSATSHTVHCFCQSNTGGQKVCCGCGLIYYESQPAGGDVAPLGLAPWLESQEFYELMQAYRHTPAILPGKVVAAFKAVKDGILARLVAPAPARPEEP